MRFIILDRTFMQAQTRDVMFKISWRLPNWTMLNISRSIFMDLETIRQTLMFESTLDWTGN